MRSSQGVESGAEGALVGRLRHECLQLLQSGRCARRSRRRAGHPRRRDLPPGRSRPRPPPPVVPALPGSGPARGRPRPAHAVRPWQGRGGLRDLRHLGERLLGEIDQAGERLRIRGRRELRQDLAVELAAGELQARDELVVGEAVLVHGGVDADDPERAELPLLLAPVAGGELAGPVDRLHRHAVGIGLRAVETARELQDLLALVCALGTAFDARHRSNLVSRPDSWNRAGKASRSAPGGGGLTASGGRTGLSRRDGK